MVQEAERKLTRRDLLDPDPEPAPGGTFVSFSAALELVVKETLVNRETSRQDIWVRPADVNHWHAMTPTDDPIRGWNESRAHPEF